MNQDNEKSQAEEAVEQQAGKKRRRKSSGRTRPDHPHNQAGKGGEKNHDPSRAPRKKSGNKPLAELLPPEVLEELIADFRRIKGLREQEKGSGLEVGELAKKWLGHHRYHRVFNANRFADEYNQHTGEDLSGDMVRYYISAYEEHLFHQESGKRFDNLTVGKLAEIANSKCASDEERLRLAELANEQKATVKRIKHLALRVHREANHAARTVDVIPTTAHVRHAEALEFLSSIDDGAIECAIMDWPWSDSVWGQHAEFPDVHTPSDPAAHLAECIAILSRKLAKVGLIFLFDCPVGLLDRRIEDAWMRVGFAHAGKVIWNKGSGGFMDGRTPVANAHEEIHILRFNDYIPKPANGYVSSVTPRWPAPTHATSGKQGEAVHRFQKPVQLMDLLISIATVNGLVVDPFAGSGAAGIAAVRRGCAYLGSELVQEYVEIANKRIALATDETEDVVDAINFFMKSATPEQSTAITTSLDRSGLRAVKNGGAS